MCNLPINRALILAIVIGFAASTRGNQPGHDKDAGQDQAKSSDGFADGRLVGYWKLVEDCRDHSGNGLDGVNHGADLSTSSFDGKEAWIEVPAAKKLQLGTGDFSLSVWVDTNTETEDVWGDVLSKYEATGRKGFQLSLGASAAGYNSSGNARQVQFGIDDGTQGAWFDCGRPGGQSHSSDALTVFNGDLYAGISDAPEVEDWAHVFRYRGAGNWEDCGRLGTGRTRGVYAMVVHDRSLYAATSASHGPQPTSMDFGHVYRYAGGTAWEDLGQPGHNYRLNCLASFRGKLYVCAFNIGPDPGHCYVYEGDRTWRECGEFAGWPHTMAVHNDRLYTAYPRGEVFAYDGEKWEELGNPFGSLEECNQIHSLGVYAGALFAGSWPKGRIAIWRNGVWGDAGRPGDATEVIGFAAYNGGLYAGTIPRAEVFRWDGEQRWTSLKKLFDPPGYEPVPVGSTDWARISDWSRATSLTVYQGRLFASTGTCHRTQLESPLADDVRGRVFSFQAGVCVTHDRDLGAGWHHLAVVRDQQQLRLFVDGALVSQARIDGTALDVSNDVPLRIGSGTQDSFRGRIRDVRVHARTMTLEEIGAIAALRPRN